MSSTSEALKPFVVGGTSAMLASAVCHPIDLAKVRLQLFSVRNPGASKKPTFVSILSQMVKDDGIKSIYSGLSASLMRQMFYGTARIGLHRKISDDLQEKNEGKPISFGTKVGASMLSGSMAVCIGTPFDVCLVRMQADSMKPVAERRGYTNVFDALMTILRTEGFRNLYSGLAPNILRGMSINAGTLACYDQFAEMIGEHITKDVPGTGFSTQTRIGASLVAGVTATAFSLPFDLIKSRLQDGGKYKGIIDVATQVLTKEGPLAFWTGFGAYYMRTAPHAMIVLLAADPITKFYKSVV